MSENSVLLVIAGLLGVIVVLGLVPLPEDKVVFLDVGQGDSILLQSGTQQVLIDGGPGRSVLHELGRELPWFDRRIEVVVLTHPQRDHMEGLLHVLERYEVEMVLLPEAAHTSQMQETWLEMIEERSIPYRFAWMGQSLAVGDMTIEVLGPFDMPEAAAATRADLNNASVMTRVDLHGMSFLLTGDAEARVERLLVRESAAELLDVDILKAGHHGSNSSTTDALLTATSPSAVAISVGADNRFGHPHPAVLKRLEGVPVWRTDEHGAIRFVFNDDEWLVSCGGASLLRDQASSCITKL